MQKLFLKISKISFLFIFIISLFSLNDFHFALAQNIIGGVQVQGRDGAVRLGIDQNGNVSGGVAVPIGGGNGRGIIQVGFGNAGGSAQNPSQQSSQQSSQYKPSTCDNAQASGDTSIPTFGSIGCLINNLTNNVVRMLAILFGASALAVFLWGIILVIKDADNEEKVKNGKRFMLWSLVALFVMVSVWGIVRMAQGILGIDKNQTQILIPTVCTNAECMNKKVDTKTPLSSAPTSNPAARTPSPITTPAPVPKSPTDKYGNSCSGGDSSAVKAWNGDILYCKNGKAGDSCKEGSCSKGNYCDLGSGENTDYGKCIAIK